MKIQTYVDADVRAKLKRRAAQQGRSVSSVVRQIVEQHVNGWPEKAVPPSRATPAHTAFDFEHDAPRVYLADVCRLMLALYSDSDERGVSMRDSLHAAIGVYEQ